MSMMMHRAKSRIKAANSQQPVKSVEVSRENITPDKPTYTKTDINRMSKEELVSLATDNGVDNAAEISGADLKTMLIEKLV